MDKYKYTMAVNMVIKTVFVICVTIASVRFGKVAVLAWYLLTPFIGYAVKGLVDNGENQKGEE